MEDGAQLTPLLDRAFGPARVTLATSTRLGVTVPAKGRRAETRVLATLAWVGGGCERLTMNIGRCPERDDEVALSVRTVQLLGTTVGRTVTLPRLTTEPEEAGTGDPFPSELRIVGVYRPPDRRSARWAGTDLFDTAPAGVATRDPVPARTEAAFATRSLLERLATTPVSAEATRRYVPSAPRARRRRPGRTRAGALGGRAPRRRGGA